MTPWPDCTAIPHADCQRVVCANLSVFFFCHFVVQFRSVCWCILTHVNHCPSHFCRKRPDCIQKISATEVLHSSNHLHRDLKPQNILLSDCFWAQVPQFFCWRGDRGGWHSSMHVCTLFIHSLIVIEVYTLLIHCFTVFIHFTCHVLICLCVYVLDGHRHGFLILRKDDSNGFSSSETLPSTCAKFWLANCRRFRPAWG